ncbi:dUTP diphosphatase [Patescibacteria group bacterium]
MILKIQKTNPEAKVPNTAYKGDAGLDLYSLKNTIILGQERAIIETGIAVEIPDGFVGLIWDRSSVPAKFGIKTMGGVIDSGYRGEIRIIMYNTSKEDYKIKKHDKVAQMLIQKVESPKIVEVDKLSWSERDKKTFGSSGK